MEDGKERMGNTLNGNFLFTIRHGHGYIAEVQWTMREAACVPFVTCTAS